MASKRTKTVHIWAWKIQHTV